MGWSNQRLKERYPAGFRNMVTITMSNQSKPGEGSYGTSPSERIIKHLETSLVEYVPITVSVHESVI
ncbi:hypothetical protein [Chlorobium ferrooxidans]|uniref:hypothetical protein n=1 Tax=Chlorobium ferrooxidans TaxID=84205 RepID=UPI0012EA71AB|nr:hypothetical protein [Chlorobium ferrooxidans]